MDEQRQLTMLCVTPEQQLAVVRAVCERRGVDHLPVTPNSGRRRTPAKRALLAELERVQREQGREPVFPAAP